MGFCVNFSRKIVAFLKARYPAPKFEDPDEDEIPFPEGSNVELFNEWFGNMNHFEDKHMDYEKDYCKFQTTSRSPYFSIPLQLSHQHIQVNVNYNKVPNVDI